MQTVELKITRIGNSKGIRLHAHVIQRYKLGEIVLLEQRREDLALLPKQMVMSWKETYKQMAAAKENLSDFDATIGDGLMKIERVRGRSINYRRMKRGNFVC